MQPLYAYCQQAFNKQIFSAANQAAQATTVALATTYTGLVLSNPNNSPNNLFLLRVSWALSVAPAAVATIGIMGNVSTTNVTHTTPATVVSGFLGYNAAPKAFGLVDSSATLPVAPVWLEQLMGGFTAAALPSSPLANFDFKGSYCIPPGGFIAIGSLTAVTGLGSIAWLESPTETR